MTDHPPLQASQLYLSCDPEELGFGSTVELEDISETIGQMRAMDALRFGTGIRHEGYNLFVLGPAGIGKRSMVLQLLEKRAGSEEEPDDWCYVNNFAHPHKPIAIRLPPRQGSALQADMEKLVEYLKNAIPSLLGSEEYHAKAEAIREEFNTRQEKLFKDLGDDAQNQGIALLRTPEGFAFAPTRNHEVIPPEEYEQLPEEERKRIEDIIAALQSRLEKLMRQVPQWRRERHERIKQLDRDTALLAINHSIDEIKKSHADSAQILQYLDEVQQDMLDNIEDFRRQENAARIGDMTIVSHSNFNRYRVNLLAINGQKHGAPIISEDHPTYSNLVGRIEHLAQFGALITDFTLIKPGALHKANGGYLLLDIRKVLSQPFAWEGLKHALQSRKIRIESLGQMYSLVSTVSLEPEPIPLSVKVILFGDRLFYYLLQEYDPDFGELFKVAADFEERMERNGETHKVYARLIATLARRESLLPFDCHAVARAIEHAARLADDAHRLSTHMQGLLDILRESDHWAREEEKDQVGRIHVQRAIDAQLFRQGRLKERLQEAILRNILMIDTEGSATGQINGLSVITLGDFAFAQPTRITATTRLGDGEMINIEREVKLSGATHSKGVLILSSFLASRHGGKLPLSFSASLVFEQSYGMIEGDSASLAELCALLSNLASAPIRQSLAVTGSVNQFGKVQAIGAVNEKIEGFFDICNARGLTGEQGVLIPSSNMEHLMLRQDVVEAAKDGKFFIYAVEDADQAIALLTGLPAGTPDQNGVYPEGSLNRRVATRLAELNEIRRSFAEKHRRSGENDRS